MTNIESGKEDAWADDNVRRGGRRQQALGCIKKRRMGTGTSIVKREMTHGHWDGNHQEQNTIALGSKD
ncbi:hypothetical protein TIFTF001_025187 [Ficus carica]|uniref:Uncharacterized protein n=1 Tax=Ficus carica TaxID=3494 RepID=A0AA88AIG1_FICCA|nr:hypothetical protein TIFTF001_025187 [Ficus carica]